VPIFFSPKTGGLPDLNPWGCRMSDPTGPPDCGNVESATRAAVAALTALDGRQQALAEDAYVLARTLDAGAGMATAAVSNELRATTGGSWAAAGHDDEDEAALGPS